MLPITTRIGFSAMSAVVAAGIVAFADPANAATIDTGAPQRVVSYADLDLASPTGRATFERRIAIAANEVCPAQGGPIGHDRDICRDQAIADARRTAGIAAK